MRKIVINLFLLLLLIFAGFILTLSTIGIETNKFNKLISDKAYQTKNINLDLKAIRFKLDLKQLSLFLETLDPELNYRGTIIPSKNIRVYLNFASIIKSDTKIIHSLAFSVARRSDSRSIASFFLSISARNLLLFFKFGLIAFDSSAAIAAL